MSRHPKHKYVCPMNGELVGPYCREKKGGIEIGKRKGGASKELKNLGKLKELVGESVSHVYRLRKLGVEEKRNTEVVCKRFCESNGNRERKKREARVKAVEEHGYYHINFFGNRPSH